MKLSQEISGEVDRMKGKKKTCRGSFSAVNGIISTASILPLEESRQTNVDEEETLDRSEECSELEMTELFSPLAPENSSVSVFEEYLCGEGDAYVDWMFPKVPSKKFTNNEYNDDICTNEGSMCVNLTSLLDASKLDVELPTNNDFWKDIGTSISDACMNDIPDSGTLKAQTFSENKSKDESPPRIEDFISTDHSVNITISETTSQIFYPIKRFTFRDADGKLALDPSISNVKGHENTTKISKPRRRLRNILSTKSGWYEMVCTGVGIGEFMLL